MQIARQIVKESSYIPKYQYHVYKNANKFIYTKMYSNKMEVYHLILLTIAAVAGKNTFKEVASKIVVANEIYALDNILSYDAY